MKFDPTPTLPEDSAQWFCVKTQPKHEHVTAMALRRNLGLECLCPRIRFRKVTRRGPVWFVEAMFPGYFFARFDYANFYRRVRSASGARSIVHFGAHVAALSEESIAELRAQSGDEEVVVIHAEPRLHEPVKIAEGAFRGLEAVVTQVMPAKERVKVLLDFLGRAVEAEIRTPHVVLTGSPRGRQPGIASP